MKQRLTQTAGFSLQEVIIVVVILTVLAAIALPAFNNAARNVANQEAIVILNAIYDAQMEYRDTYGSFTGTIGNLDVTFPAPGSFNAPSAINSGSGIGCGNQSGEPAVGRIDSDDGNYRLYALRDLPGEIGCCPTTVGDNICQRMGFQ